ncbi:MAG: ATP-binding protein, partial [Proteobacteria bacterium]
MDGQPIFLLLRAPLGVNSNDYVPVVVQVFNLVDNAYSDKTGFMTISASEKTNAVLNNFSSETEGKDRAIIIRDYQAETPSKIVLAIDTEVILDKISPLDFRATCRALFGIRVSPSAAEVALGYPSELLWAALRKGRSIEDVLARLAKTAAPSGIRSRAKVPDIPPLTSLHGYASAKTWGIELAEDLSDWSRGEIDWSEVDKGIVLSGPPGVGKTIFAKALALHCNVPLIATSLGQWQANGHLGDLLKAMRRDFSKAKESVPSILFCDELDSFGDRKSFSDDNRDYSTQVVNAFLEHLDGLGGREGVVVIGATNNIQRIDPAILRPGRLDRHVVISLPDAG